MTTPGGSLRTAASRAAGWGLAEIVSRQGIQLVAMLALARLLAPEAFALFALILVFTTVGSLLAESGLTSALVQRGGGSPAERVAAATHGACVGFALCGLTWWLAPALSGWIGSPELAPMLRLAALAIPATGLALVPDAVLIHRLDFRARAVAELVATAVAAAMALTVAVRGGGAWSLATLLVVAPTLRCLLVWCLAGWWPNCRPSGQAWRGVIGFGANIMLASLLDVLVLRLQSLLLARSGDMRGLGHYSLAQNIHLAPATLSAQLLYRLGLPLFSRMSGERARLVEALDRMNRVSTFVIAPPLLALALAATSAMSHVFGLQWKEAGPILSVLAVATVFWPVSVLNLTLLNALGRSDLFLRVEVVKKVVMVGCLLIGVRWGGIGLAWAVLVSAAVSSLLNMGVVGRLVGHGVRGQLLALSPTIAACGIALACGLAARLAGLGEHWAVLVFVAVQALMVLAVDRGGLRDLLLVGSDLMPGRADRATVPGDR